MFALFKRRRKPVEMRAEESTVDSHAKQWLKDTVAGTATKAGARVTVDTALNYGPYFAAIRAISEDVARLPFVVYQRLEPRGKRKAVEHPVFPLLHLRPNDEMSSMSLRETLTAHALSWGNGYAEIVRDRLGRPAALLPIHPSRVQPKRVDGQIVYDIRVTDIGVTNERSQTTDLVRLPARDVLHVHGLGPDGLIGYSAAKMAREAIGLGIEAETFGSTFFGNGAMPGGTLEHPHTLKDEAMKRLRESWKAMHGGASKAHKVAILEEGMKYTPIGIANKDSQFLESRQFQVVEIARWFRIQPHKIGSLERSTFNNIEQQSIDYVQDTLMPWFTRWEQEVSLKLFTEKEREGLFAEHVVNGLLRGDAAQRSAFYREQFAIGALSPNDIRELENQNPIPGPEGDEYFVNAATVTLKSAAEGTANAPPTPPRNQPSQAEAMRPVFEDAAARVVRREAKALERACKKFEGDKVGFYKWADGFFAEQKDNYVAAFGPICNVLEIDAGEVAVTAKLLSEGAFYWALGHYESNHPLNEDKARAKLTRFFMDLVPKEE